MWFEILGFWREAWEVMVNSTTVCDGSFCILTISVDSSCTKIESDVPFHWKSISAI